MSAARVCLYASAAAVGSASANWHHDHPAALNVAAAIGFAAVAFLIDRRRSS